MNLLTVIFWSLLVISFGMLLFLAYRHFPEAVNLDVGSLPEEIVREKKRAIIKKRLAEQGNQMNHVWHERLVPVVGAWNVIRRKFRSYVGRVEYLLHHEVEQVKKTASKSDSNLVSVAVPMGKQNLSEVDRLISDAGEQRQLGNLDRAEQLLIAAISTDHKSLVAYEALAAIYLAKNALDEAEQTLLFIVRLNPKDDRSFVKLGEIAENKGNIARAIECYEQAVLLNDSLAPRFYHLAELLLKSGAADTAREAIVQAVELEPQNTTYLDVLVETAILCNDKTLAERGYQELRLADPANQKLVDFHRRIGVMK